LTAAARVERRPVQPDPDALAVHLDHLGGELGRVGVHREQLGRGEIGWRPVGRSAGDGHPSTLARAGLVRQGGSMPSDPGSRAGTLATPDDLVDVAHLVTAYFTGVPDPENIDQQVA